MTNPRDQSTNGEDWAVTQMNGKNTYTNSLPADQRNWGFNGDFTNGTTSSVFNSSKPSFFKSIRIYGFNQHNFSEYVLINPMIDAFDHDTYSYSETSGTMEHNMTIKYETVKYYTGALNGQKPGDIVKGFGDPSVYDTEMSPIGKPGTNKSIMGQGGLVDSVDGIIKDVTSGNILGAIQTAGRVAKTFKNPQQILQAAKTELTAGVIAATPGIVRSNFNFPSMGSTVGSGSQQAKQNLAPVETITPVPVNNNNPI
jgi:hypothetical protein